MRGLTSSQSLCHVQCRFTRDSVFAGSHPVGPRSSLSSIAHTNCGTPRRPRVTHGKHCTRKCHRVCFGRRPNTLLILRTIHADESRRQRLRNQVNVKHVFAHHFLSGSSFGHISKFAFRLCLSLTNNLQYVWHARMCDVPGSEGGQA